MRMRPVKDGLAIPPHGKLVFSQGGSHLMFLHLTAPFSEGGRVPVSLDFEKAGRIDIALEVGGVGAKGPPSAAASEGFVAGVASGPDSFFTHIHDPRVMANVTVSPGRSGPVEVVVQLEDPQENALAAEGLSVALSSPDNRIVLTATAAERIATDTWRALMSVSEAGRWNLALRIVMKPNESVCGKKTTELLVNDGMSCLQRAYEPAWLARSSLDSYQPADTIAGNRSRSRKSWPL
jgi:hypothetical protein